MPLYLLYCLVLYYGIEVVTLSCIMALKLLCYIVPNLFCIYCITLYCIAFITLYYIEFYCIALYCSVLHYIVWCCIDTVVFVFLPF